MHFLEPSPATNLDPSRRYYKRLVHQLHRLQQGLDHYVCLGLPVELADPTAVAPMHADQCSISTHATNNHDDTVNHR
jgi:hypothetical protein